METIKIKQFLSGDGDGSGSGDGYGDGDGDGSGSGDGYGDGDGYGNGDGSGDGYGYGSGDGYGYGSGYGSGDGNGNGSGDGSGVKMEEYKKDTVHYIDGIPCIIQSLKDDYALVEVIDAKDLSSKKMYVAKRSGFFAHGVTLKEAVEQAEQKWISSQTVEEKIAQFKNQFKKRIKYKASLFYEWHSLLTGSCKVGKDLWVSQHGIDLDSEMTVESFIELTKNAYGGDIIRRLTE